MIFMQSNAINVNVYIGWFNLQRFLFERKKYKVTHVIGDWYNYEDVDNIT